MKYYELAPRTGRSARILSRYYGFDSIEQMAESLPQDAVAADFGSGRSNLGKTITDRRSDVRWMNVDVRTGLFRYARRHQKHSAPGLQYVKADVFHPPIRPGTLDRGYSSWLLPNIELDSRELAIQAFHSMATLLKDDGMLSVTGMRNAIVLAANYYNAPEETANAVIDAVIVSDDKARRDLMISHQIRGLFQLHRIP
jgi:hypothetical protein